MTEQPKPGPRRPKTVKSSGAVPMLDTVKDMEPIVLGQLNYIQHYGLHVAIYRPGAQRLYGRIVGIAAEIFSIKVKVCWDGTHDEYQADPETVIRIETTI